LLEDAGQLDDTLVVLTSDNGFPYPRGKATCYDAGTRMPLAVRWPARVKAGRVFEDFFSLTVRSSKHQFGAAQLSRLRVHWTFSPCSRVRRRDSA
jgi:hypothetical protein